MEGLKKKKSYYILCFSYEIWKLHEVLHLTVSTARELCVRLIQLGYSIDHRHLFVLLIILYQQSRNTAPIIEAQNDLEDIHPTEVNTTSYDLSTLKILTMSNFTYID